MIGDTPESDIQGANNKEGDGNMFYDIYDLI